MNRRYTKAQFEEQRFFQVPKALYENEQYGNISNGSKMMYSILRDRQDLSIKNEWLDYEGYIFFYFDCRKLSEYMNISTSTINKYKKEIASVGLLEQERQGQGRANRMYILMPETVANSKCSDNDYTRYTENATLEVLKSLHSDTKVSDTEKKDTERLQRTKFDGLSENDFLLEDNYSFIDIVAAFCKSKFNKPLRKCVNSLNLQDGEEHGHAFGYMDSEMLTDFLNAEITSYDICNLDYLNSIKGRSANYV